VPGLAARRWKTVNATDGGVKWWRLCPSSSKVSARKTLESGVESTPGGGVSGSSRIGILRNFWPLGVGVGSDAACKKKLDEFPRSGDVVGVDRWLTLVK
jgi:hypothetical protein